MSSPINVGCEKQKHDVNNNNFDDNLLRLSLSKPKEWDWELTTSKSSPHIIFPRIQLYDSRTGSLLVEADDDDCVYQGNENLEKQIIKGVEVPFGNRPRSNTLHESLREKCDELPVIMRSRSASSRRSLLSEAENMVKDFVTQLEDKGIKCTVRSRSVSRNRETFKEELTKNQTPPNLLQLPGGIKKSKSAAEVHKRVKKPYSRSSSSVRFTSSFLQRMRERNDSSSDSELEEKRDRKYYYRSSKAGTLLLCEDNSCNQKEGERQRRSRNLDSVLEQDNENLFNSSSESHLTKASTKINEKLSIDDNNNTNIVNAERRKGNILQKDSIIRNCNNTKEAEKIEEKLKFNCDSYDNEKGKENKNEKDRIKNSIVTKCDNKKATYSRRQLNINDSGMCQGITMQKYDFVHSFTEHNLVTKMFILFFMQR